MMRFLPTVIFEKLANSRAGAFAYNFAADSWNAQHAYGFALAIAFCGSSGPALCLELGLPIACEVGQTCFIQNYVDHDSTKAAHDYMCGRQTYDGHDGTDFRLPSMAQERAGVAVLAAADGKVLRTRDGMPDVSVREIGFDQVKGRECGNGVIVAHTDGFESDYCHMAQGSVRVKPGDTVKLGQPLGNVGLSGNTEFAHLHFTLRQNGKAVDPFAYGAPDEACGRGSSFWDKSVAARLAYRPAAILNSGFAAHPVTAEQVEAADAIGPLPDTDSEVLVGYVRAIGLRRGDVQRLSIVDPDGKPLATYATGPLERDMAQYTLMTGRKRPADGWLRGSYRATYQVERNGALIIERTFDLRL
jgi:hypothetical protein